MILEIALLTSLQTSEARALDELRRAVEMHDRRMDEAASRTEATHIEGRVAADKLREAITSLTISVNQLNTKLDSLTSGQDSMMSWVRDVVLALVGLVWGTGQLRQFRNNHRNKQDGIK